MKKYLNIATDWVTQHPLIVTGIAAIVLILIVGAYTL